MPTDRPALSRQLLWLSAALLFGCGTSETAPDAIGAQEGSAAATGSAAEALPKQSDTNNSTNPDSDLSLPGSVLATVPAETTGEAVGALMRYAERLRVLSSADLAQEVITLGLQVPKSAMAPGAGLGVSPKRQMQLALALVQLHQPVETARALALMQRVVASSAPESNAYKPLARLLIDNLISVRRLEDTAERQAQQLREAQRKLDQLNERLEAMRAIERSLNAPANPTSPATPNGAFPRPVSP